MISIIALAFLQVATEPLPPTWHGQVQAIVIEHCSGCHSPEGAAPFKIETYDDVKSRAGFINTVVRERIMPPWLPGSSGVVMQGHRGLSTDEIEAISIWVNAGMPLGEATGHNHQGSTGASDPLPNLKLAMPAPWPMPAEGGGTWGRVERDKRTFVLPMNNNATLKVRGMAYKTSSPRAVHAVTFLADPTGSGQYLDARDNGPGYYMAGDVQDIPSGSMGGTGVGARTLRLPKGYHWEVPANSDVLMQVHYRPTGRIEWLRESLDLWYTDDPNSRPLRTLLSMIWRVDMPPGDIQTFQESWTLPVDVDLVGLTTRANGVVTHLNLNATLPSGESLVLLDIPDHDPHWRQTWLLETATRLPAGTEVHGSWELANTESNPRNPFVPLDRYVTARRTGTVATLLHGAAVNPDDDAALVRWHQDMLQSRQRIQPPVPDDTLQP